MGNLRNRRRKKKAFNAAHGVHSRSYKIKNTLKRKLTSTNIQCLNRMKGISPFQVKSKKPGLKYIYSRLCVKKALKYRTMSSGNRLFFLKDSLKLEGNRIFNLEMLRDKIVDITAHTAICDSARNLAMRDKPAVSFKSEKRNGIWSVFECVCLGCNNVFILETGKTLNVEDRNLKDINVRTVWGSMVNGGGCSSVNEILGTMGIPGMSENKYSVLEREIGKWWSRVLDEEMVKAGEEERKLAVEDDDFFQDVPAITVIADGGWSKRSHKHSYNAMAGVGVIFGEKTKKLLHIGIRNKLCYVCSRANTNNVVPVKHECFKNWEQSSQSMESDIILEGFLNCEKKYGVRYMRLIADGDSSTYASIIKNVPGWGPYVTKLECSNHATKCLRSNLEKLIAEKSNYKGKGLLTKNNIRKIVSGVRCAIRLRSLESDKSLAVRKLRQDIRNAGRHVLGLHDLCSTDFCKHRKDSANDLDTVESEDENEEDIIINQCSYWEETMKELSEKEELDLRKGGKSFTSVNEDLLKDVFLILNRLAEKSSRLIGNFTSNLAESWMHIRCKFDGGKMLNKCFRGSFYARCYGSALRSILGPAWSPQVYSKITCELPDQVYLQTYQRRAKKHANSIKASKKSENIFKRKKRKILNTDKSQPKKHKSTDYGDGVLIDTPDISPEHLQKECQAYYDNNVVVDKTSVELIEIQTRGQSNNEKWLYERKKRLTSSNFGEIFKRSVSNCSNKLVNRLLYNKFKGNTYTIKGLNEEQNARKEYIYHQNKDLKIITKIDIPGLIVDEKHPYLAASSDGIVYNQTEPIGLIEIKTVLQKSDTMIKDAAQQDPVFCLRYNDNDLELKQNHNFYYQIQGQLNILNYKWCDLIIRRTNPHDMHIIRVIKDEHLWNNLMVPKLKEFFFKFILPELACPRHGTLTGIRQPAKPWFEVKKGTPVSKQSYSKKSNTKSLTSTPPTNDNQSQNTVTVIQDTPSTSSHGNTRTKRCPKLKFVGRRIKQKWEEDDGSLKWYFGTVVAVIKGKDGDVDATYQVYFDDDDATYDVDSLHKDYIDGSLKFCDI